MEDIFPSTRYPDFNIISLVMLYCLMDVRYNGRKLKNFLVLSVFTDITIGKGIL